MLVIGYGNCLRGDDGVGAVVAQAWSEAGYQALAAHQLTVELAEPISQADLVVFVDACVNIPAGMIQMQMVDADDQLPSSWSHQVDAAHLLTLARAWYGNAPPAIMIGVGAESFGVGEALSPHIQNALPTIFKILRKFNPQEP